MSNFLALYQSLVVICNVGVSSDGDLTQSIGLRLKKSLQYRWTQEGKYKCLVLIGWLARMARKWERYISSQEQGFMLTQLLTVSPPPCQKSPAPAVNCVVTWQAVKHDIARLYGSQCFVFDYCLPGAWIIWKCIMRSKHTRLEYMYAVVDLNILYMHKRENEPWQGLCRQYLENYLLYTWRNNLVKTRPSPQYSHRR